MLLLEHAALSPGGRVPFGCIADPSHSGPIYFFPIPLPILSWNCLYSQFPELLTPFSYSNTLTPQANMPTGHLDGYVHADGGGGSEIHRGIQCKQTIGHPFKPKFFIQSTLFRGASGPNLGMGCWGRWGEEGCPR